MQGRGGGRTSRDRTAWTEQLSTARAEASSLFGISFHPPFLTLQWSKQVTTLNTMVPMVTKIPHQGIEVTVIHMSFVNAVLYRLKNI